MLPKFTYLEPKSMDEAVNLLNQYGTQAKLLAGGTDLLVQMKHNKANPEYVIALGEIKELYGINEEGDGLVLGALTTHRDLELSPLINQKYPIIADAVKNLGSVQVRNLATVGGNLCNGAPSADTAPPLLALGTILVLKGPNGERKVPLNQFYLGPSKTVCKPDEILTKLIIPSSNYSVAGAYIKHARRRAMDLSIVGVAVFLEMSQDGQFCENARIALGTSAPTPIRISEAEKVLAGQKPDEDLLRKAGEIASQIARPRTSSRSTESYRRAMIKVLVRRAGLKALERLNNTLA